MTEPELQTEVRIQLQADLLRSDCNSGLAWFVNYAAIDPAAVRVEKLDLHNTAMLPEDVEMFAHRWLAFSRSIDINHDGIGRPIHCVESFFNSDAVGSSSWPKNSHAVRFNMSQSAEAMDGFRAGRLNCISLDALTFNVKRRLPVDPTSGATANSTKRSVELVVDPVTIAREVAQLGFTNLEDVVDLGGGLMLVRRGLGAPPVAVQATLEDIEVNAGGGAWAHLAARLLSSGTLTVASTTKAPSLEGHVPNHGDLSFRHDFRPWEPSMVDGLLAEIGFGQTQTPFAFIRADGQGEIPHHTTQGVNKAAVLLGLGQIDRFVPEKLRVEARKHLVRHLQEMP